MGLIIKDKIPMFIAGYPTVSDKYNVKGGILDGEKAIKFGQLVQYGEEPGHYEAVETGAISATGDAASAIAGFALGTNVKVADWDNGTVEIKVGEAFNLLIDGFIAVPLAATAKNEDIIENAAVHVTADGEATTSTDSGAKDTLPGAVFTGMYEIHGTTIVAEVYIK